MGQAAAGWRRRISSRCRALVGKTFDGPHASAEQDMLGSCLGRRAPKRTDSPRPTVRPPRLADIIFFDNSRDENRNGRLDDRLTHRSVVVAIDGPRVEFVYLCQGRVRLGTLNMAQPNRRRLRGRRIQNTFLRVKQPDDGPRTRYLAGQLLAGFVTPPTR